MIVAYSLLFVLAGVVGVALALVAVLLVREQMSGRLAQASGIAVIAVSASRVGSLVGIDCGATERQVLVTKSRLAGGRLVRLDGNVKSAIEPEEVWRLIQTGEYVWYGMSRYTPPIGRFRFKAFLSQNSTAHQALFEDMAARRRHEWRVMIVAVAIAALIIVVLMKAGLIGQPTSFP